MLRNAYFMPGYMVNQRGVTLFSNYNYGPDRWKEYAGSTATISVDAAGMALTGTICQKIPSILFANNEVYTLGICFADGHVAAISGTVDTSPTAWTTFVSGSYGNTGFMIFSDSQDGSNIGVRLNAAGAKVRWAGLFHGAYTADTLPLPSPPDPDLELLACQKYFWRVKFDQYETIGCGFEGPAYAFVQLSPPVQMRAKYPRLTQSGAIQLGNRAIDRFTNANCNGTTIILGINYPRVSNNVGAVYGYSPAADGVTLSFSAEL